jgi:hypothetical protein
MLFDVVNELDLSDSMVEEHGPRGTAPAILVREVLAQKDLQIRMLRAGFKEIGAPPDPRDTTIAELRTALRESERIAASLRLVAFDARGWLQRFSVRTHMAPEERAVIVSIIDAADTALSPKEQRND